jgi:type I restriction enzyme S subunit
METKEMATAYPKYSTYKDSGVEWLGEIPDGWNILRVKYLFKEINDRSFDGSGELLSVSQYTGVTKKSDKLEEGDLLTNASTLEGYKIVKKGDLVSNIMLAWNGSLGFSSFNGITSPAYSIYRLKHSDDKRFFHYLFRTDLYKSEFKRESTGVIESRLRLYTDDFFSIWSILPPLAEQTAIANFLDEKTAKIDRAIAQKERLIELLKERKQIIVQDAVTGKVSCLNWDLQDSPINGINATTTPRPMKPSGVEWIGEIPEGWEVKKLKYILKSQGRIGFKGYTTSDLVDKGNGALTLGASHMDWDGNILLQEPVYISWKKYYESPEIMVQKGDILIVQRGSTCGKVALVIDDLGPTTINPSLVLLKEIKENTSYVFYGIKVVLGGILNVVSNTAIPMLSQFQIDNIEICIPPQNEQKLILKYIETQSAQIDKVIGFQHQQIEKLKEYKAVLIDSAVTGKIKVN